MQYPKFMTLEMLYNLFSLYAEIICMKKVENNFIAIKIGSKKHAQLLRQLFDKKQFGSFCFEFGIFKKELMISQETINNEPKQVKEHITIGKTYLFS